MSRHSAQAGRWPQHAAARHRRRPPPLTDSTDILHHADAHGTRGERLFPDEDDDARALEQHFDDVLGPHEAILPLMKLLLLRGLKVSSAGAARSRVRVEQVFIEVEQRLADGRRFLGGPRFNAGNANDATRRHRLHAAVVASALQPPHDLCGTTLAPAAMTYLDDRRARPLPQRRNLFIKAGQIHMETSGPQWTSVK